VALTEIKTKIRRNKDRFLPFSPILELLTVVLILEILLLLALPNVKTAILKTTFSEILTIQKIGRIEVQEYYAVTGKWPSSKRTEIPVYGDSGYGQEINHGVVSYILPDPMRRKLSGDRISFYPKVLGDDGTIFHWYCGYANIANTPDITPYNKTDIPEEYLLHNCKYTHDSPGKP
jgi:type IV pilus assembly protein PilA